MSNPISAIQPGDVCTHCGGPTVDYEWKARRIHDLPFCGHGRCYDAQWAEWRNQRHTAGLPTPKPSTPTEQKKET